MGSGKSRNLAQQKASTTQNTNNEEEKLFSFEPMNKLVDAFTRSPNTGAVKARTNIIRQASNSSSLADEHIKPSRRPAQRWAKSRHFMPILVLTSLGLLIIVSFALYDLLRVPEYVCPSAGQPAVDLEKGRRIMLAPSSKGEVCVIQGNTILGRSYSGFPWEHSASSSSGFSCLSDGKCSVYMPSESTFQLTTYSSPLPILEKTEIARFLIQSTFGPTKSEIQSWGSKTFKEWIVEQIELPASLHRSYFRQRANPRLAVLQAPGRPKDACEDLSRWHRYTFTKNDIGKEFVVSGVAGSSNVTINIGGVPRVEIRSEDWDASAGDSFKICKVEEFVGGEVEYGNGDCKKRSLNPALHFGSTPERLISLSGRGQMQLLAAPIPGVLVLKLNRGSRLDDCLFVGSTPIYVVNPVNDMYYQHDRRLVMVENTLESPAEGDTAEGSYCARAPKTFLNMGTCIVGGRSCAPVRYSSKRIELNNDNIRKFYVEGGHYVYRIEGLRTEMHRSPCDRRQMSRWLKVSCSFGNDNAKIDSDTLETFRNEFLASTDENPILRDFQISYESSCDGAHLTGATLSFSGSCWKNVHPQMYNVYDLTWWSEMHRQPNKISDPAEVDGQTFLSFPTHHGSREWGFNYRKFPLLGRFRDVVDFSKLPSAVQSRAMAAFFDLSETTSSEDDFAERCGSPGEVANDASLGARFAIGLTTSFDIERRGPEVLDTRMDKNNFRSATWTMRAIFAVDQLRQRMAFALSQILVISQPQLGTIETEAFLAYYDIFVRHAFGNYRDILREVSFSPMMADMLTFLQTKSFDYSLRRHKREVFPDENYAREIMQLFTIGLVQLNNDGSVKTDGKGNPLETYTNEDIMAFSRAWTGFDRQSARGNIESVRDVDSPNRIDPMRIVAAYRDQFPKMNLFKGHIGDGYPLCIEFPEKMFLRRCAKWLYLGKNPMPTKVSDPDELAAGNDVKRVVLNANSELYGALCNPDRTGKCRYKSFIRLEEKLPCRGIECKVDTMRVVKVGEAFYEFVRPPCVRFPFFNNGIKIQEAHWRGAMCAHPKEIVAAEACCERKSDVDAHQDCLYAGERLSFATAQRRCAEVGKYLCDFVFTYDSCYFSGFHWTSGACSVHVKISNDDGKIAVVHDPVPGPTRTRTKKEMRGSVREDNRNWFRVAWSQGIFPSPEKGCEGCNITDANHCLCEARVEESAVFSSMPSHAELTNSLYIGSLPPDVFDDDEYTVLPESTESITAYSRKGGTAFDKQTVFSLIVKGEEVFLVNMVSRVVLANGDSFRNPANLMGIAKASIRDAEYETEAVIDHFFKHPNCPPFIAYRIIQRFVTSNPSPRFIDVCAKAFSTGSYESIGSGKYGDLSALIAAVLLDREARDILLDSDPVHGQMREPLLKIIHVLRSLEVTPRGNREIELDDIHESVGEMAHMAPDVFSFFKPEYSPPGPLATALLTGPEAQLFTGPKIVSMLNGLLSLGRFGLTDCYGGFGNHFESHSCSRMKKGEEDASRSSPAKLAWYPESSEVESIVDELSLLLMAGRLANSTRLSLVKQIRDELSENGLEEAIVVAKQLLLTAPEFHTSTLIQRSGERVKTEETIQNSTKPYKAIVYIMLYGGMDSFNLVVPHSRCKDGKDKYEEYRKVRTDIALAQDDLLQINVKPGSQVCDVFGLHPSLPRLQEQYNQGDLLLMANVGPLVEPITKEEVNKRAKARPESLFAHNIQQQSAQTMLPQQRINTGVMGRMNDAIYEQGYSTSSFSISGKNFVQQGRPGKSPSQSFMNSRGLSGLDPAKFSETVTLGISKLNSNFSKSFHGETWTATVSKTMARTEILQDILQNTELEQPWTLRSGLGRQLKQVAKLIKSRGVLGSERQTFFAAMGGFDTHSNVGTQLMARFEEINEALGSFEDEMKLQGQWNDVVIIVASEFGRTITSNGAGTDHGWGGNYFILGGGVRGGTMIGEYPEDLSNTGKQSLGRGRLIPTTSWDSIWNGVAMWFGVEDYKMTDVLPNRANFEGQLLNQNELFGTHDPASLFHQWAVILGTSIMIAILGLGAILAANKRQNLSSKLNVELAEEPRAPKPNKTASERTKVSKGYGGETKQSRSGSKLSVIAQSVQPLSRLKAGNVKSRTERVRDEAQDKPPPKLKSIPVFAKVPFWAQEGANSGDTKRTPKLANLPPIRKGPKVERGLAFTSSARDDGTGTKRTGKQLLGKFAARKFKRTKEKVLKV